VTQDLAVQGDNETLWYFTFGCGQIHAGYYVRFFGTFAEARRKMFERYGDRWAFQYSQQDWLAWEEKCRSEGMEHMLETELNSGA
jgi:hypothetical protein